LGESEHWEIEVGEISGGFVDEMFVLRPVISLERIEAALASSYRPIAK
jgi:hypothetical protein